MKTVYQYGVPLDWVLEPPHLLIASNENQKREKFDEYVNLMAADAGSNLWEVARGLSDQYFESFFWFLKFEKRFRQEEIEKRRSEIKEIE